MTTSRKVGLAIIAYPLAELLVAILAAQAIGWYGVFVVFVVGAIVGLVIARLAARATGRSWSAAMAALRQGPANDPGMGPQQIEVRPFGTHPAGSPAIPARTALLVPAGILIAVPGFLTDVAGLLIILPPVRSALASRWERAMRRTGGAGNPPPKIP